MDNKQNRNFYLNIKDFMSKPHNPAMPQINPKTIKESINGVLNQNAAYKTTNFQSNITSARHISQAISAVERNNQKGTPDNIGNTKNITSNPFGVVNEGIFDDIIGGLKGIAEWGHGNALGSNETKGYVPSKEPLTQAQASQNNINVKNMSAKTLTPEQQKFEQSASVPIDPTIKPIDTLSKDQPTPNTTPAAPTSPPPPPPPPPSDTPSEPAADTQDSSGDDVSDKISALRYARSMRKGDGDGGGKSGAAERTAERRARSDAIRDANLALRSTPEGEKAFRQEKASRSTTQGNIKQSDIALRYAKPGQRVADTQSPEETARIADEFVASQKEGRKPNYQASTPAPASAPAGTIPIPTPAAPAPATSQRAMDSWGQGSLPNNSGGMQNAKQPQPAPAAEEPNQPGYDPSKKQYSTRDGKIQTVNSKIAKMTTAPKTSLA